MLTESAPRGAAFDILIRMVPQALFLILLFSFSATADPVVFIGNHNVRGGAATDDRPIQKNDVCKSIEAAERLGNEVYLFMPGLTCGSKKYPGRCVDNGCTVSKLRELFTELGGKLKGGKKENLLIQTIGHGGRANVMSFTKNGPEYNDLVIEDNPQRDITAVQFADLLKASGVLGKVSSVKGLFTQCYGGGWHELARLISPPGKFCALSSTTHNRSSVMVDKEIDALRGSAFAQGFWRSQEKTRGTASLSESGLSAGALMRELTTADPYTTDWRTSSIYFTEKDTQTGPFGVQPTDYRQIGKPPYAYFADGLDPLGENVIYDAFYRGIGQVAKETQAIRDRYRKHVYKVNDFNDDKWFWQDAKHFSGSYLLNSVSCPVVLRTDFDSGVDRMEAAIRAIQSEIDRKDFGRSEDNVRRQIAVFEEKIRVNRPEIMAQIDRYWKRRNALMDRSGILMRRLGEKGIDPAGHKKAQEEYQRLDTEFNIQDSLASFPALQDFVSMAKKVNGLKKMLSLMNRPDAANDRDLLLGSWSCENEPVFQPKDGA